MNSKRDQRAVIGRSGYKYKNIYGTKLFIKRTGTSTNFTNPIVPCTGKIPTDLDRPKYISIRVVHWAVSALQKVIPKLSNFYISQTSKLKPPTTHTTAHRA